MTVQFAGGHRIAVENRSRRQERGVVEHVRLAHAMILPFLFVVFRSLWLVTVGSLPSGLALLVVLGAIGFTGERLSAAATGAAAMLFGLGIDGVVLLYVAHRLALADNPDTDVPAAIGGPIEQHAARDVDNGRHVLRIDVRGFPEPAAPRPAARPQHDDVRHSHVDHGASVSAASAAEAPRARAGDAAARRLDFAAAARDSRRCRAVDDCARGVGDAASVSSRRSIACGRSRLPRSSRPGSVRRSVCRATSTSSWPKGSDLQLLLETNERLAQRLAAEMPGLAFQPPSRLLPSAASQAQSVKTIDAQASLRRCGPCVARARARRRRLHARGVRSVFREAATTARSERAAHTSTATSCTVWAICSTGSSCATAAGGRSQPTCFRPARSRPRA